MHILLADSDLMHRRLLKALLERWNHRVSLVEDGQAAWDLLRKDDGPTLAILDWCLPGIDGPELCRRLRRLVDRPNVFVILLITADQRQNFLEGLHAGADDYMEKPFEPQLLAARLVLARRFLSLQGQLTALQTDLESAS